MKPRVVLSDPLLPDVVDRYRDQLELVVADDAASFGALLAEADGCIVLLSVPVDDALLDRGPRLKVVGNFAVGVDNIDLAACRARDVQVVNTPDVLTRSTAELALTLALCASRRVVEGEHLARSGKWQGWRPDQLLGLELRGRRATIVGRGRIGQQTGQLFAALGLEVQYITRAHDEAAIDARLAAADVVSLHLPLNDDTRGWMSASRLARLKPGAVLVNTARGPIVDEPALIEALAAGRLRAGLDVFDAEPHIPAQLRTLDNVVLLPHLGSATRRAREGMADKVLSGVAGVLAGQHVENLV